MFILEMCFKCIIFDGLVLHSMYFKRAVFIALQESLTFLKCHFIFSVCFKVIHSI